MSVVLQLKERLNQLKHQRIELSLSADASIKAARDLLATSSITPLLEIDLARAQAHINHAIKDQDCLKEVMEQIHTIERELGQ
jgi:hypothetical protein